MSTEIVRKVEVKNLLRKEKRPGLFSGRYRFSPYMACGHKCIYCDGRFEKYGVKGDFDRDITARVNAPDLLKRELEKLREPGPVCISSGVSDPYQPVEAELNLTGRCAGILAEHDHPVIIHTKSALALRDIDTWQKVHKRSAFTLMVSLTMTDDSIRECIEPGASSVEERLSMIREFRNRGMNAGVLAMPFVPGLTDSREQMEDFLEKLTETGAQFAMPGLLTLKEGRQKGFFFSSLRKCRPDLVQPLMNLYSNNDQWGNPPADTVRRFYSSVNPLWRKYEMDDLFPHSIYRNQFTLYDQFTILLNDMIILYGRRGTGVQRLRDAAEKLGSWIASKRQFCARRRNQRYSVIDDYLRALIHSGELDTVICNDKLSEFLVEVEKGAVFNYGTLELEKEGI